MADFNELITLIHSIHDREELADLLLEITSEKERQALAQRHEIIKRLIAGEPQAAIAAALGVGIATGTRGSKELS